MTRVRSAWRSSWLVLALGTLFPAASAHATLGESAESIQKDKENISILSERTQSFGRFSVHEYASGATRVRQYISPSGVVFGIHWIGRTHPPLDHLLGTYYKEYQQVFSKTNKQGRGHRTIKTS
jgi:hypothetical protein